ncbi:transglycosylase SLT domain-containing protein [Oleidesulfovibrio alaskensis]|jgi:membrane-bound lytic murein transglycosylase MltF|uniref:transglycosylase SLT domain-containing protein n=1 Tax=Oleidesulfovibrio alaskensis TaxID=58180 RepID=UPI00041C5614|nr:transglycosylase SLT domain-containing protein [Oleidesulfovibrio alaskensis]MBL3581834.1 transglycosylase SLT domain-containing protein [Oleidesulfovibrio alaskensis]
MPRKHGSRTLKTRALYAITGIAVCVLLAALVFFAVRHLPEPAAPLPGQQTENGRQLRRRLLEQGIFKPFTGDIDAIRRRKVLRMLVPYNRTDYFLDGAAQRGLAYDTGTAFAGWLNKRLGLTGTRRISLLFIPAAPDDMLRMLREGQGDMIGYECLVPGTLPDDVTAAGPWSRTAQVVVVSRQSVPPLQSLAELSGKTVYVLKNSAVAQILDATARTMTTTGIPVRGMAVEGGLTQEDLLDMVSGGSIAFAAAEADKAALWARVLPDLQVHANAPLTTNATRAWLLRSDTPQLNTLCNEFIRQYRRTTDYAWLRQKYFSRTTYVADGGRSQELARLEATLPLFIKYGEQYDFAPLLLAAQGYQESRLNQQARSHKGAVGIMQLLPATAAASPVGITDISTPENNIHAGVKYLAHLRDTYFDSEGINYLDRMLLSFAAYNAGPGNIRKARRATAQMELNPDVWRNNVEKGVAATIGQEPVRYVRNIITYYIVFQLVREHRHIRDAALQQLDIAPHFTR